jgi:hypothetical protein
MYVQRVRNLIAVLAVNCPVEGADGEVQMTHVDSTRAALNAVRLGAFDLLLTGNTVDAGPVWPLMQKLRMVRPKLQWWLVAHGVDPSDERLARTLGMARLLATRPTLEQIAMGLRPSQWSPGMEEDQAEPTSALVR